MRESLHGVILLTLTIAVGCQREDPAQTEQRQSQTSQLDAQGEERLRQAAQVGADDNKPRQVFRFFKDLMGTRFHLQLVGYDQQTANSAARAAFNEVARVERLVSSWRDDSEIGALNLAAGTSSVPLSLESAWLLCRSAEITKASEDTFDVTWAALKGLWSFRRPRLPDDHELKRRLTLVGIDRLSIIRERSVSSSKIKRNETSGDLSGCDSFGPPPPPPPWSRFSASPPVEWSQRWQASLNHSEAKIDLGGIAKGFGIDQAARVLDRLGYRDYLVDGGGDLLASGRTLDETPWSVGIAHPRKRSMWGRLWVPSGWSVVTSGDYERYFLHEGRRYHHIIDLRTGYPAQASVAVTVIARSAMLADAYATALFVLGPRDGLALAEITPELEAIFFTPDGDVTFTEGARVFSHHLSSRWR